MDKTEKPQTKANCAYVGATPLEETMKTRITLLGLFLAVCIQASPTDVEHKWETGKVVDQLLSSSLAGAYAGPIGSGAIAVPLYQQANDVAIETTVFKYSEDGAIIQQATYRYGWHEVGRKALVGDRYYPPKYRVILVVNTTVRFYRDGDLFVVMDDKNRPHKFILTGAVLLPPQKDDSKK